MPTFPEEFDLAADGFLLRRLVPGDAAALARISQDEETLRWAHPTSLMEADAAAAIAAERQRWARGETARFAIAALGDDRLLGTVGLTFYGPARASVGYDVAPEARGCGIATGALKLVSDWAFENFDDLVRLELWIVPGNEPSFRVAERAGFQREGVLRSRLPFGDEFRDVVSYSLLRSDPR